MTTRAAPGWVAGLGPPAAVFALAAAVRVLFVLESASFPTFVILQPGLDADLTWRAAWQLRHGTSGATSFELWVLSAPLHVLWTALLQAVLGEELLRHRLAGAVLGGALCAILFAAARRVGRCPYAATAAALAVALLPASIVADTRLMKMGLELLLLALLVLVVLRLVDPAHPVRPLRAGAAAGALAALLHATQVTSLLVAAPVLAAIALAPRPRPERLRLGLAFLGVVAAVAGVLAVDKAWTRPPRFAPQGGLEVLRGNNPAATGWYVALPGLASTPTGGQFDARLAVEARVGRALDPAETSAWYLRAAGTWLWTRPLAAAALAGRKALLFANDLELRTEDDVGRLREVHRALRLSPFGFGGLLVLAVIGVVALARAGRRAELALLAGIVGAVLAVNVAIFVSWRYRLPAVVPLCVLAAAGLVEVSARVRALAAGPRAPALRALAAAVVLPGALAGALAWAPVVGAGERAAFRAEALAAEQACRALAAEPVPPPFAPPAADPAARRALARRLGSLGRHTEAFLQLRDAVPAAGDAGATHQQLTYLLWLGDDAAARALLARSRRETPETHAVLSRTASPAVRAIVEGRLAER